MQFFAKRAFDRIGVIRAVEADGRRGVRREKSVTSAALSCILRGQFVAGDAGAKFRVARMLLEVTVVQTRAENRV